MPEEPSPKRYLVTGCAGFIGAKRSAALLLAAGHQVLGLDNINPSYDPRLKSWRLAALNRSKRASISSSSTSPTDRCAANSLVEMPKPTQAARWQPSFISRRGPASAPWSRIPGSTWIRTSPAHCNVLDACRVT